MIMSTTREERRRTRGAQHKGNGWQSSLYAVPRAPGNLATAPVRLTWPMLVGIVIAVAIIALGAVALGNGGSLDIGITRFELFPRAE